MIFREQIAIINKISKSGSSKKVLCPLFTKVLQLLFPGPSVFNIYLSDLPNVFDDLFYLPCHTFFSSNRSLRRQIDIVTYKLLYFLPDTSLCLFVDDLVCRRLSLSNVFSGSQLAKEWAMLHPPPPCLCMI